MKMNFKKWILTGVLTLFAVGTALSFFNYIIDPFGVFGGKWDSYNMTNNPRVAKIGYLDEHHEKYDSYVIGGSKSSSFSPELLNEYYEDANFYSTMMYGGDFYDYEKTLNYLVDNYDVENIILHLSLREIGQFNDQSSVDFKQSLHAKVMNDPLVPFYLKYLFLNPTYGYEKIEAYGKRLINSSVSPDAVFIPETGVYNKVDRDAGETDNLEQFTEENPDFELDSSEIIGSAIDENIQSLKRMKEYADSNDISFRLITGATYSSELERYNMDELKEYWSEIAKVTDFWDFSGYTSVTKDPRYFYDSMHYNNNIGEMMLGKIFDDPEVYVPNDFGHYTTASNVTEHANAVFAKPESDVEFAEEEVPILMYHHIDPEPDEDNSMIVSPDKFRDDMHAINAAGYETIHLKELLDYVKGDAKLPDNPIVITLDDGYSSNYEYVYPILKEYKMKATISVIGWSVGKSEHRIKGAQIYPHFSWDQAREMYDSGLVEIQNHSFDMHEGKDADRHATNLMKNESTGAFSRAFKEDTLKLEQLIEENLNNEVITYTYPLGQYSLLTEQILQDLDYDISLSVIDGINIVQRGNPSSLFAMKRINIVPEMSSEAILQRLEQGN